ncbi:MAG: hypothetical protein AABN33_13425 [Acidobacteriota bacterium]
MEDTWPSKTDVACDCNYLHDAANDPGTPIEFDASLNEFHIVYSVNGSEGYMLIRHCPFCGGKAPASRRASLFATISVQEQSRLAELTKSLKRLDDVTAALGEPDRDEAAGLIVTRPKSEGRPPETQAYRTLTYTGLSETADVRVTFYTDERVEITFCGKCIGDDGASHARHNNGMGGRAT